MPIDVDSRVGSVEIAPLLATKANITTLPFADFAFTGYGPPDTMPIASIGIERKTIRDLLNSIQSGRLSGHQLIGLTRHYHYVYLLVEGIYRPTYPDGVVQLFNKGKWRTVQHGSRRYTIREIQGYINTLAICAGVHTVHTGTPQHTALWLDGAYRWWQKPYTKHTAHLQAHTPPPPTAQLVKPNLVTRVAKEYQGVGWDKARALGQHFPTVMDFVMADETDLLAVAGIGKKLAAGITKDTITEE